MKKSTRNFRRHTVALFACMLFGSASFAQMATIVGPTVNCQGSPLTLTVNVTGLTGPYTYQWTNGATTATVTINATTLIRVNVTGSNGSVNSPWRLFLFFPSPTVTISASGPTNLCVVPSVDLTANANGFFLSYAWSTGATTQTITVNTGGTYTVTVTNLAGCTGEAEQIVTASTGIVPKVEALGPVTFCKPGSVMLEADTGATSYLWSTGETTQSIVVAMTGSGGPILDTMSVYYLIEPGTLCETKSDVVVVRSIREPHLEPPYCPNFNMALSDSIKTDPILPIYGVLPQYDFEFEETTNPGTTWMAHATTRWMALSSVSPALQVGKFYNVRTRGVVNGIPYCFGNFCQIGITSLAPPAGYTMRTYVDESGEIIQVRDGLNFGIYPNPSSDQFTAKLFTIDENPIRATVYDMAGRTVAGYEIDPSLQEFRFGSELLPGIYLMEFSQGGMLHQTVKIIKTNQ